MNSQTNQKWYANGLAFSCQGCGNCCSGPEEGYVWADKHEIEAMARHLHITAEQFKKQYARRVGIRFSLIEKQPGKDCIFLTKTQNGKGCEVYPVRPLQCRTWPFWNENIRTRENWDAAAEKCPGMNNDIWYDFDAIEAIRKGDLTTQATRKTAFETAAEWISRNHSNTDCLQAMQQLYTDLDQIIASADPSCENCGKCCDFKTYGHRLYITTLEMFYFLHSLARQNANRSTPAANGRCPYQDRSGCNLREYRPTGCRIFYCTDLDKNYQAELTEQILQRLQSLHKQFNAAYYYANWLDWLNTCNKSNMGK
jgi:hypothetical protein